MSCCTFFGHRDCPGTVRPGLRAVVAELIETRGVDEFYVGRQGAFDAIAWSVLRELGEEYPHIRCTVVLERLPGRGEGLGGLDFSQTIFPEGLETAPPRLAILRRNQWMLAQADYVVTYITRGWGGAARFAQQAVRQHKGVFNLAGLGEGEKKKT